ncbi:DUF4276 family protein [Sphaerotilaceae bacterium SBD11-9]
MIPIATIVEGDGEVSALPILLRRLANEREPATPVNLLQPIRVKRDRFLNREEEFRRQLLLAAAKSGDEGWILILLDADDDCPMQLGQEIRQRALQHVAHRRLSVVLANREFEAWFIAAAQSLHGARGFSVEPHEQMEAEAPRNAKGWMREHMQSGKYSEILDQPAFTARIDLQQAFDNSRSFRKLCTEWQTNVSQRLEG